jgi:hypothetical protein
MADFAQTLSHTFLGAPGQFQQQSKLTPQQSNLLNQNVIPSIAPMLQQLQQRQGQGFAPIAQQATKQFQTQSIPSLAQRFGSMGNSRGGSDYLHALSSAEAGLQGNLAALGSQYDLQNQGQQQQLLQSLLGLSSQPQFESLYLPGSTGVVQQILPFLASLFGARVGGDWGMGG